MCIFYGIYSRGSFSQSSEWYLRDLFHIWWRHQMNRVTGLLCGEFTGDRWIPRTRPVTRSFDVFIDVRLYKRLSKQSWGWWFETPSHPIWRHCNDVVYYELTLRVSWKFFFVKVSISMIKSVCKFTHITTVLSSWYRQNCNMIVALCCRHTFRRFEWCTYIPFCDIDFRYHCFPIWFLSVCKELTANHLRLSSMVWRWLKYITE